MVRVNPYLNFAGNTEEAFNFYKSVFGGEFAMLMRFEGMSEADGVTAEDRNKIMHIALPIGKDTILMGTDALSSMGKDLIVGNNFFITLSPYSREEADTLYNSLSDGGTTTMPMADQFWGAYHGMLTDKFGIQWMIDFDPRYQNA